MADRGARLIERLKPVPVLAPSADVYNGDPSTTEINMAKMNKVLFILSQVTGGTNTGTATVTVEACDNAAGDNPTAIAFEYWVNESADTADTAGAKQTATTSGFSTTANVTAHYYIEVRNGELPEAKPFVRLTLTETVDDACIGEVVAVCDPMEAGEPSGQLSAIT